MTQLLRDYNPALRFGAKILSSEVLSGLDDFASVRYVDGDNGSDANNGSTPSSAFATIQAAVTASSARDIIYIRTRKVPTADGSTTGGASTDPANYAETIIIPQDKPGLKLIGLNSGRTQGGLPQIKPATTTSPLLTIRAAGTLISGLGFNGVNSTGGGILLDSDGGATKDAFGTTIIDCHFKNCVGTTATDSRTGGAIMWSANGACWQTLIKGNRFYKNVGDIIVKGTSVSVPQDIVIEDNIFSGPIASVDCNIYTGGSGVNGLIVRNNVFTCIPTVGSGSIARVLSLTGSVGVLANNQFATTGLSFGASTHTGGIVPTTVLMAGNFDEAGILART